MAGRSERQAAADGGQSFGHAAQAGSLRCLLSVFGVGGLAGFACGPAGQAAAVVGDLQRQLAVVLDQAYPAGSRAGMPDHVGHGLAKAPGQHGLRVGVERARPQRQAGVVVEPDAGRLQRVPRRDHLNRQRRPAVAADRLPDVLQGLPADPADVAEVAEHRVAFGRDGHLGQPLGRQLGLQRDRRQRLAGQVVHVAGQPEPFLVGGQLRDGLAGLGQLVRELHLHPEPDHGEADEQDGQQHDEEIRRVVM